MMSSLHSFQTVINKLQGKSTSFRSFFSRKNYISYLSSMIIVLSTIGSSLYGQTTIQIGSGTTTTTRFPVYTCYTYNYTQMLYTGAEITAAGGFAGNITAIRFYYNASGTVLSSWSDWTVYLGNTGITNFGGTAFQPISAITQVFTGNITAVAGNWVTMTLSTPFNYTGGNLIVAVDENSPASSCTASWRSFTVGAVTGNLAINYYSDPTNPNPSAPPAANYTSTTIRPQIQLDLVANTPCAGTPNIPLINGATSACAGVNFSLGSSGITSGLGITYQWQSSTNGGVTWTNVSGANATSLTTNATTTTQYQLVTTCSNSGLSSTSLAYTVTINPFSACTCMTYPISNSTSTFDEEITNVTVGAMNNSSDCFTPATGAGSLLNRYANYAGVVTGPSHDQGSTVPFSLTQTTCNSNYGSYFQVYLDWNQDGDFLDLGEQVYVQNPAINGNTTVTGFFTVPMTATAGVTRMRVVHIEGGSSTTNYAQATYSYGETEDYCFTVTIPPPCVGTPAPGNTIATPAAVATGSNSTISLQNTTSGTGVTYQWYSSLDGITYAAVAGQTASVYTANITANIWFYCDVTCAGSTTASTPTQVTLTYCTPSTSASSSFYISNFTTNNALTNVNNTTGFSVGGYGNYSATQIISALPNSSISFNASFLTASTYGYAMYIDANQDLDFNDAGEQVYNSGMYVAGVTNGTFTLPAGCVAGQSYRLRIRNDWFSGSPVPCGVISYGEAEDYTISIVPNCSSMPTTAVSALSGTSPICFGNTIGLGATGVTLQGGINNQWSVSTTAGGPYTAITGATSSAYTTANTMVPGTYYAVFQSTCSFTSQTSTSNEISFTIDGASSNFTMTPASFCGTGGNSVLNASPAVSGAVYTWINNGGSLSTTNGQTTTATLVQTSEFTLNVSFNGCTSTTTKSIGVYNFPSILPTATPSTICGGTSAILETGLSASNFAAICIPVSPEVSPTMGYTDLVISGISQVPLASGSLDDGGWSSIPLGFSFNFFGTSYSTINVGTNGVLQFGTYNATALGDFIIGALPNTVDPMAAIYGCVNDLHCGYTGANLKYWTAGAAPNRRFIIDYQVFQFGNAGSNNNFQIILYETLGQVDIVATNIMSTNTKSIGVNSPTGTIGAAAPNCNVTPNTPNFWSATTTTIPSSNPQAWKFIPPVTYGFNWTVNGTSNPAIDQLNGSSVTTSSTTQSPLSTTNYQVYILDPITNCSQIFQTPVTVIATPSAPTAVNWTQCGTQIPQATVSCPTCTGNQTFNWYTAPTNGSLFQGVISENFNTSTTGTLYGNAALSGARCVLTENIASQNGAILLGSTGVNSNAYNIDFDFQVGPSDALGYNGADGFSYSFGDDVDAIATTPAAENGSGSKLKVGFVSYSNGGSTAGIYLMYNCTGDEQTPATPGVVAYSSDMSWKNTTTPVAFHMGIDALGQVTLTLNNNPIFTSVALPGNYLLENKATWLQLFKARTGAGFSRHAIDNLHVEAQPAQAFTSVQQSVSTSATYYVQTLDGICGSIALTPVTITVNPSPALAITSAFTGCQNLSYPITITTGLNDFANFTWSPASLLYMDAAMTVPYTSGTSATTVYFSGSTVGPAPSIVCTATDNGVGSLQCGASASVNVTIQANPVAPTISSGMPAVCSGDSTSLTVQSGASGAPYCNSGANYTWDEEITNVTIGTLNNTSTCFTAANGPGSQLELYSNYTSGAGMPTIPNITAGTTTSGTVEVGSCGSWNYTSGLAIFIDLNQDGDFNDAGEKVYSNGSAANIGCVPATIVPVTLTIPSSALNGQTRMRIVNQESYSGDIISPCTVQSWGETEDYLINITNGVSNTYIWTPSVSGNSTASSVSTLPLTSAATYTTVLFDGLCYSAPSNAVTVAIAGTPVITTSASVPVSNYCTPQMSFGCGFPDIITNVTVAGINNSSACDNLSGANAYSYVTTQSGTLAAGSTGNSYSISTGGDVEGAAAWIDFNQDGLFDPSENLFTGLIGTNPATYSGTFNVPATAVSGITRMRVRCIYFTDPGTGGSCSSSVFGETEDYDINISGGSINIPCPGSTFNLNASAANGGQPYAYTWSVLSGNATLSATNIANPTSVVTSDATFQVTVSDDCGSVVSATVVANIAENPITITPSTVAICINDTTALTAANGINYVWTPTNNLDSTNTAIVNANPNTTTTYSVSATYGIGCTGTASSTITVNSLPAVSAGIDQSVCLNTAATVVGSGATSYTWDNSVIDNTPFTPSTTNTYTVTGVDANGCQNQDQMVVTVMALPVVSAGIDQTLCLNIPTSVAGSGALTYTWTNSVIDNSPFTPIATNTYTVTGVDANGCQNQDQMSITVLPLPNVGAGIDQTVCLNTVVTLTGSGALTYTWDNSVTNATSFTPTSTATYTVTGVDANGCQNQDQATITVLPLPAVSAGVDQSICLNTATIVVGSGAVSYAWNNGVTNSTSFTPVSTNTYTVTGTGANGCQNQDQMTITVLPLPVVSAGQDYSICQSLGATLTGSGANTYTWNNNVFNGIIFIPNGTQTYVVTGTAVNGCSSQDSVTITVNTPPTISLTNGGSSCANGSVSLSATIANSYGGFWTTTNGGGSISPNVSNSNVVYNANTNDPSNVNFTYVAFNQCGSTSTNTSITILPLPTVNGGLDVSACTGANVTLTAATSGTVVWNSGLVNGVPFAASQGVNYYIATATGSNGCTNTDTVSVTGLALPDIYAGDDQSICAGEIVTVNGNGGTSYAWNNGVVDGVPFSPTASGVYTVTGTGSNGCTNIDNMNVSVNALPNAVAISADPVTMIATPAGANYQWINCATGQTIADADNDTLIATANGSYAVIVTNANGCSDTSNCIIVDQVGLFIPTSAQIGLYPNPTNGMVTIELPSQDGAIANIYDAQGKLVFSSSNVKNGDQIDLSKFTTGIYTFKVQLLNLTHIEKVVKQ